MRFDDAVETFKSHAEYEESTAQISHPENRSGQRTVPELTRRHVQVVNTV